MNMLPKSRIRTRANIDQITVRLKNLPRAEILHFGLVKLKKITTKALDLLSYLT